MVSDDILVEVGDVGVGPVLDEDRVVALGRASSRQEDHLLDEETGNRRVRGGSRGRRRVHSGSSGGGAACDRGNDERASEGQGQFRLKLHEGSVSLRVWDAEEGTNPILPLVNHN
ncbi:hypothetical protein D3C87_1824220 [compost metagenome]